MTRYIFITGGVVSSLGKGLSAAALGALLQARGFKVRLRKLDPYLNVDPGTMSPYQHGEVYVTDDGAETDLDLGASERYPRVTARRRDSVTPGRIYSTVSGRERRGEYLGATVQVIPHVTDAIKEFIQADIGDEDFVLCEIGGTVGDIESLPFLEAIRQLGNELGRERTLFVHLTLVPWIPSAGELKTKPTQHSVKELLGLGIQPDILLCRCDRPIPSGARKKIALFCNLREARVIPALDVQTIYAVPEAYHAEGFDMQMAVIEAARNLADLPQAGSTEFGPCREPVIGLMTEWVRGNLLERRESGGDLGGTMRLGAYEAILAPGSRVSEIYGATNISERHRHRYEVNINYKARPEDKGLLFSGMSPDCEQPQIVQLPGHPWFIGVQFHPELKSKPFEPHPLFTAFIRAALDEARLV